MVKTPRIQPSSPLAGTLYKTYVILAEGILTMTHII